MKKKSFITPVALILITGEAEGQSVFTGPLTDNEVLVEYLKPSPKVSTAPTGYLVRVSGLVRLTDGLNLFVEIPYAQGNIDYSFTFFGQTFAFSQSNTSIGNIAVGLQFESSMQGLRFDVGSRLPAVSEGATLAQSIGTTVEYDEIDAYVSNALPINGAVNYRYSTEGGFCVESRFRSSFLVKTKKSSLGIEDDIEVLSGFSVVPGYDGGKFFGRAGYSVTSILTEEGDLDRRTFQQLGVVLGVRAGLIRLSGHFRWPIDKTLKNGIDNVYGFQAAIEF
jgi:hypothetical protein